MFTIFFLCSFSLFFFLHLPSHSLLPSPQKPKTVIDHQPLSLGLKVKALIETKFGWCNLPTAAIWWLKTWLLVIAVLFTSILFTVKINWLSSTALYVVPTLPLPSNSVEALINISKLYTYASPPQNTKFPLFCTLRSSSLLRSCNTMSFSSICWAWAIEFGGGVAFEFVASNDIVVEVFKFWSRLLALVSKVVLFLLNRKSSLKDSSSTWIF